MALHLNDEHIAVLTKVRDVLAGDHIGTHYICWNIIYVVSPESRESKDSMPQILISLGGVAAELVVAIDAALGCQGTMDNYLTQVFKKTNRYDLKARPKSYAFANMARVAWLDRMIETRVLA
jgi:hypothetical protein